MTVTAPPAWADILAMYQRMTSSARMLPNSDPWSVAAAQAAGCWDLSPAGRPPVLSTEHPFPIRYAATVWEQLHPIDGPSLRRESVLYLPNPRSNVRKR
jgi:hypothetical protein